jgi:Domain of unknown function (DUF4156)/Short C-terminal domain
VAQSRVARIGRLFPGDRSLGVRAETRGGGGAYTTAEDKLRSSQNELRNKTAELGGNYVVMDAATGDVGGTTMSGRAFRCDGGPPGADAVAVQRAPVGAPATPPPSSATPEERLTKLKALFDQNLITKEEYEKRRSDPPPLPWRDSGDVTTSPLKYAAEQRRFAAKECEERKWEECAKALDRAAEADPEGERAAQVKGLREMVAASRGGSAVRMGVGEGSEGWTEKLLAPSRGRKRSDPSAVASAATAWRHATLKTLLSPLAPYGCSVAT